MKNENNFALMSKDDPRSERIKQFIIPLTHNIGIQMKLKELIQTFIMISI